MELGEDRDTAGIVLGTQRIAILSVLVDTVDAVDTDDDADAV